MEYGIGRVPADVDPTSEALATLDAMRYASQGEIIDCPHCGMPTYRSNLMSASTHSACPDCYDDDGDGYGI